MKNLKSLAIHRHASICTALLGTLLAATPFAAVAQNPALLRTFNNPTPAAYDFFGLAFATLGSDRILVGAPNDDTMATNAGAVYLFHTNGTLLTTISNPNPAIGPIGDTIATLGSDRVLIGSSVARKVYLFTTNGILVSTITGPPGLDGAGFGAVLAAFGKDKVLIGAPDAIFDTDVYGIGGAYLYNTNGTLLMTFKNPDPGQTIAWGFSMAAFGNDRVLISANNYSLGSAHLFNTNGTLLTTFTDPAPQPDSYFGMSVAAVGADRILVSAYGDDTLGGDTGRVYIFNTNGALQNTITNPAPQYGDSFGAQLVVLGKDRLVISAPRHSTTAFESGSAYVFDINGALVATINNPAPANYDFFGWSLAPFGSQGVLIGAQLDDAGATDAGSAYLFSIPSTPIPPSLSIQRTMTNTVVVSWPSNATGFTLQQNTNGLNSVNWSNVTAGIQTVGTNQTLIVNPIGGSRFYRLVKP